MHVGVGETRRRPRAMRHRAIGSNPPSTIPVRARRRRLRPIRPLGRRRRIAVQRRLLRSRGHREDVHVGQAPGRDDGIRRHDGRNRPRGYRRGMRTDRHSRGVFPLLPTDRVRMVPAGRDRARARWYEIGHPSRGRNVGMGGKVDRLPRSTAVGTESRDVGGIDPALRRTPARGRRSDDIVIR